MQYKTSSSFMFSILEKDTKYELDFNREDLGKCLELFKQSIKEKQLASYFDLAGVEDVSFKSIDWIVDQQFAPIFTLQIEFSTSTRFSEEYLDDINLEITTTLSDSVTNSIIAEVPLTDAELDEDLTGEFYISDIICIQQEITTLDDASKVFSFDLVYSIENDENIYIEPSDFPDAQETNLQLLDHLNSTTKFEWLELFYEYFASSIILKKYVEVVDISFSQGAGRSIRCNLTLNGLKDSTEDTLFARKGILKSLAVYTKQMLNDLYDNIDVFNFGGTYFTVPDDIDMAEIYYPSFINIKPITLKNYY